MDAQINDAIHQLEAARALVLKVKQQAEAAQESDRAEEAEDIELALAWAIKKLRKLAEPQG